MKKSFVAPKLSDEATLAKLTLIGVGPSHVSG